MSKEYRADQVAVIFGGVLITGKGTDTFVSIEWDSDAYGDTVGVDGEVARHRINDDRATVTITVMATSPSNAALDALHKADKANPNGTVAPLLIKDNVGDDLHAAQEAWILREPAAEYGQEAGEREWRIRCAKLVSASLGVS